MTTDFVRIDKWLWAARFFKTRSLAKSAIEGGKIRYNGARCKPSKLLEIDAELSIRQGWIEKTVVVKAVSEQRRGASEASALYDETGESIEKRELEFEQRKLQRSSILQPGQRPTKKQRRQIIRFQNIKEES